MKRVRPIAILATGAAIAITYGFPGYMNFDSADQLKQARAGFYADWHAPMMARYWHAIERVVHGPLPLLLLQVALFLWGMNELLRRRFQPLAAALAACAILLFPPVLTPIAVVWKDAQMAAWLIAGTMFALRTTPRSRLIGMIMLMLACAVRDNACTALPPLLLFVVGSWGVRGKLRVCGVAFALFVVLTGTSILANQAIARTRSYAWTKANAIHDIAGTICLAEPMSDEQVRSELVGIPLVGDTRDLQQRFCKQYTPRWWFPLSYNDDALFRIDPDGADRDARRAAWFRLVKDHTRAFLHHRWNVTKELLGLTVEGAEQPVCQSFSGYPDQLKVVHHDASLSWLQSVLGRNFVRLSQTVIYRPWAYVMLGLIFLSYALHKRDGLVVALIASGFLYELSFLLGAAGPAYRYSHWMITCVCLATAIIFGDRFRAGRRT